MGQAALAQENSVTYGMILCGRCRAVFLPTLQSVLQILSNCSAVLFALQLFIYLFGGLLYFLGRGQNLSFYHARNDSCHLLLKETGGRLSFQAHQVSSSFLRKALTCGLKKSKCQRLKRNVVIALALFNTVYEFSG